MKAVVKYQTFDGELHDSEKRAVKHLEGVYGSALSKVAHALLHHAHKPGHMAIGNYVDSHLADFLHLQKIKDDHKLIKDNNAYD